MNRLATQILLSVCALSLATQGLSKEIVLEDYPVNYGIRAKPNILMSIDDSGSMDFELSLVGAAEGLGYWSVDDSFVDNGMPVANGGLNGAYSHLFPVGDANATRTSETSRYNGGSQYPGNNVPPFDGYGFMRSSDWNKGYYNPNVDYRPWPSYGGFVWPEIDPEQAWLDPSAIGSGLTTRYLDLTALTLGDRFGTGNRTSFNFRDDMWCEADGTLCSGNSSSRLDYWAATYYVADDTSAYKYDDGTNSGDYQCSDFANGPVDDVYDEFHDHAGYFTGVDAFAPDGSCLERVEIRSTLTEYPSGRDYQEELQNFANWFTYHRKRHQVARGALGYALQGISGVRTGLFWINNRRNVEMFDLDVPNDVTEFLSENYYYVANGGTPNSDALRHAGSQLDSSGSEIIQYACQKNYTLMFTDGYTNYSGNTGNIDGSKGAPYSDTYSNTLADIAQYYYDRKLRDGDTGADGEILLGGRVPVPEACTDGTADPWLDCNSDLHMNTYTVSLGLEGRDVFGQSFNNGSITGTYEKVKDAFTVYPTWPNPSDGQGAIIDDLYHTAVNGRGEVYNANSPDLLQLELQAALRQILAAEGSASGLSFNSATLNADSIVFNTVFNTTNWTGNLIATLLDPATGQPDGGTVWNAQEELDNQNWNDRFIVTYNPVSEESVVFDWANLSVDQQSDLNTDPDGNSDSLGEQRLDFLKGDRSREGTEFRRRSSVLGDIVSSTPAYVAGATVSWPDYDQDDRFGASLDSHSEFRETVKDRTPMIYVGANDGMLHGFDASSDATGGQERFAYVPSSMYSDEVGKGLHYLTDPDYTHRFYVDAEPAFSDVFVGHDGGTADWMTILSGGFRTGAKGFYALDITDPSQFNDANVSDRVLFEYSDEMDPYLGYIFERPTIGMMANGEWAMIYGNGFNSIYGEGAVYVVFIEKVLEDGWIEGNTFLKFKTEVPGAINGITAIDYGTDRVIDAVYASDAGGYMWKLELSDTDESNWDFAYRSGDPVPLFEAKNEADEPQPIITRPRVIKHTSVDDKAGNAPNRMVIFGTGSMVDNSDLDSTEVQSFYVVWDDDSVNNSALDRGNLSQSNVTSTTNPEGFPVRDIAATQSPWTGGRTGFRFDLPIEGERVLDYIDIREARESPGSYYAIFSSVVPDSDVCNYGGTSWIMAVDLKTGGAPTYAVFDANGDGVVDSDDAGVGGIYSPDYLVDFVAVGGTGYGNTSTGDITTINIEEGGQVFAGRMGWQELIAR
ncbi:pilus assembly protein [Saccharospirillum impatiens]|uniref:pilus assembly protein n=1 Tax=Saccharospirillum impatiens TaxID=169438 RepID=UPI00040735DA|nr:PilC/PilY family type IV pilus protein [Saccharospirillum impatiens]